MITIALGPEPHVLIEFGEMWGEEYADALESDDAVRPERYRRNDIRDALRRETHGKCAYCESMFDHVSFAHIEHILPKSERPRLVCTWWNLTLACSVCNTNKGSYLDEDAPLLNPYRDNVEQEIGFFGPMALDRSDRAKLTISRLKLNRPQLLFRRHETLNGVLRIMDLMKANWENAPIRAALMEDLQDKLAAHSEHTSCTRCFVYAEAPSRGLELALE